jgi:hypothetical protein
MSISESRARAGEGWQRGDVDAFLRRLEMAKICPEFPVDRTHEARIFLSDQVSRNKHGLSSRRALISWLRLAVNGRGDASLS